MEDRISGGLQHCYETCCEKGGRHGRWACMVQSVIAQGCEQTLGRVRVRTVVNY